MADPKGRESSQESIRCKTSHGHGPVSSDLDAFPAPESRNKVGTAVLYCIIFIILNVHICLRDIPMDSYFGYSLSEQVYIVITSHTIIS